MVADATIHGDILSARMKQPCTYILCSRRNGILYVGVMSALPLRMFQHVQGLVDGFTKRYGIKQLVYYEMHETMPEAIAREKQLKSWRRAWKVKLIMSVNPEWVNLFDESSGEVLDGPADVERRWNS